MSESPLLAQLASWASELDAGDAPDRVVAHLRSQLLSQLAAARAGYGHPLGAKIGQAYGSPLQDDPERAAHSLAMATICLDFDDTAYAGHLSHSCVNVPLVYARPLGLDGRRLATAILAANECAARITAAATLGPFRGQTAGHTHLAGAVAGRLRAEGARADTWVNALGLAFTTPTWTLPRGFLTTDAKLYTAAVPVRIGLGACDGARAGLSGPADVLEHPQGFLHRFAALPLPEEVVGGLGTLWYTQTLSYKVHPGSAYLSAAIDCAAQLHSEVRELPVDDIAEVVVEGSLFTSGLDRLTRSESIGPRSSVAALNFSVPYNVATALLTGSLEPADLAPPDVARPERWALAAKVRTVHDPALSRAALLGTAPLGQALRRAGRRAAGWAGSAGREAVDALPPDWLAPADDFRWATKDLGARVTVRLRDGRELRAERRAAVGAAGSTDGPGHEELARRKFLRCGGKPEVVELVENLAELGSSEVQRLVELALGDLGEGVPRRVHSGRPASASPDAWTGESEPSRLRKSEAMWDTTGLELAYDGLFRAMASRIGIGGGAAAGGGTGGEMDRELAHLALGDRLLADTARQVLDGAAAPVLDNSAAADPVAIDALIAAADRAVLAELVRRNAAELVGLLARTPDRRRSADVRVRLVNGAGEELFSGAVPWGEIVRMRAEEQLPGHAARINSLDEGTS
ncbi:MmgE/PrpD family protein [Streptomyces sp. NPDC050516]|uniref:MmgE/PrpD family protein n=1 Tax=Streptomyces sp. NPDC050516 TaxID=3365621 RepID=UPI0037999619